MRDHVTTGWGNFACVRDEDFAVHMRVTGPDFADSARVYDLRTDPREEEDVAGDHREAIIQAVSRLESFAGPLPLTFRGYRQRARARSIRTYAPFRYGKK